MHYQRLQRTGTTDPGPTKPDACVVDSCDRKTVVVEGYCDPHYRRWRKTGDPGPALPPRLTLTQRFEAKVEKTDDECWFWTARIHPDGYGIFYRGGKFEYAHRVSYELHVGPIPEGMQVDHVCHTEDDSCRDGDACVHRRCVNPAHLEAVTQYENNRRSRSQTADQARQTHCKRGHEFTHENTYTHRGKRHCRQCRRDLRRGADDAASGAEIRVAP